MVYFHHKGISMTNVDKRAGIMNEISLEELKTIHEKGLVPKASRQLYDNFSAINQFMYHLYEVSFNLADTFRNLGNYESMQLYQEMGARLEELIVRAKEIDLSNPYDPDSLSLYRESLRDFVDNEMPMLAARLNESGMTENFERNLVQLDAMHTEFQTFAKKEDEHNTELLDGLKKLESEDVILNPQIEPEKNDSKQNTKDERIIYKPAPVEEKIVEPKQEVKEEIKPTPEEIKEPVKQEPAEQKVPKQNVVEPEVRAEEKIVEPEQDHKEEIKPTSKEIEEPVKQEPTEQPVQKQSVQEPQVRAEEKSIEPKQPQEDVIIRPVAETSHDTVNDKKQEKKDVAQEPEDALKREDKVQEEVVSQEKPQEKQNTNEAAIARLRQIVDMFDRQNSDESFKKMMFALKEVADSKMVPDEMVDAYRAIFEKVKKHGNTERGIFDLSTELYNQIDELQNPEDYRVASEENTPKKPEKVMTHEDVAQKESDLKPKSDKEIEQQTEVREDMMVRKDARPGNVDEKDKKQQVQHRIDNFTNGNQKVLDMDNKRENSKKELNQAALAAYRRRVLEGRGTPNV